VNGIDRRRCVSASDGMVVAVGVRKYLIVL
jgi:hypothetical protein